MRYKVEKLKQGYLVIDTKHKMVVVTCKIERIAAIIVNKLNSKEYETGVP